MWNILENSSSEKEPVWDSKGEVPGTILFPPRKACLPEEPEGWSQGSCSENVTSLPEDPAVASTRPKVPSAITKKRSGRAAHPRPSHQKRFSQGTESPLKSPKSGLTGSEQSERQVPDGGENSAKSQRRLVGSSRGRGCWPPYRAPQPGSLKLLTSWAQP